MSAPNDPTLDRIRALLKPEKRHDVFGLEQFQRATQRPGESTEMWERRYSHVVRSRQTHEKGRRRKANKVAKASRRNNRAA